MPKTQEKKATRIKQKRTWLLLGALCLILVLVLMFRGPKSETTENTTFAARRGPLTISVLEGGNVHALESQIIRCEVDGRNGTKILSIVEEGYQVTEEDVANGKILVELDSSEIRERLLSQETDVQATMADLAEQIKTKEVRENRSLSELKAGNLKKKFALMDFQKYMGEEAAKLILEQVNINEASVDKMIAENQRAIELPSENIDPNLLLDNEMPDQFLAKRKVPTTFKLSDAEALVPKIRDYNVDFSIYASEENEHLLGNGEASQELRKFNDSLLVAKAELNLKEKSWQGAIRLHADGYLTDNELQEKEIAYNKASNNVKSAEADLELFKHYDLQKKAEQFLLNYEQALLELARLKSDAMAELSDAFSDVEWSKRHYNRERAHLLNLEEQLSKCVIRAERPGLVVYGDGRPERRWDRRIREGTTVWRRQAIITIPDMREMALTVKIHESQVKRIQTGQIAKVVVDAEADKPLTGVVYKVGLLPDSENQQFNPDQKVYKTTITINERFEWLKPGMTAKAEIVVRELDDVVYVPLQAVIPHKEGHACFIQSETGHEFRSVEVLDYNNRYCAIQNGLNTGEEVFLRIPKGVDPDAMEARSIDSASPTTDPVTTVTAQISR